MILTTGEATADNPPRGNSQDVGRRNNQSGSSTGMKHAGLSGGGIQSDELLPNAGMGSSAGLQGAPTGGTESLSQVKPCSLVESF